jgi:hypothetical protein
MQDEDSLTPFSLKEFDKRTNHTYWLITPFNAAQEHWADKRGKLLGVVTLDQVDHDHGYAMLGRDEHGQFRAVDVARSHPSIEEARNALHSIMRTISTCSLALFPQED